MAIVAICTFLFLHVSIGCDYFYPAIDLMPKYLVDNITIGEIIEISFELQLNDTCGSGWCHILRITDEANQVRLPMINIPASYHGIRAVYSDSSGISAGYDNEDPHLLSTFNDANYHHYYFKWSKTERIFIYDGIVYTNITDGSYDSSNYIDKQYGLWIIDTNNPLDGNIVDLCINSSWYGDTDPNQCTFYHKNPIQIIKDNQIGSITIDDTIEVSFDLQLTPSWNCTNGWCNILRIGSKTTSSPRFPLLAFIPTTGIHMSVTTNTGQIGDNIEDLSLTSIINDGNYHRLYFKMTYTEKLFIFDYNFKYNFAGELFDEKIGNNYAILVCGENTNPLVNGLVKNLCVNTYKQTNNPTINPTYYPTYLPSINPTFYPTNNPSTYPSYSPTQSPTIPPSNAPTTYPTYIPTYEPTNEPTIQPSINPTTVSQNPTINPTQSTANPTDLPTDNPTDLPTNNPTKPIGEVEHETTMINIYNTNSNHDMNTNKSKNIFGNINNLIVYILGGVIGLLFCIICCLYILYLYRKKKVNNNNRIKRVKTLSSDSNILRTNSIITPQYSPHSSNNNGITMINHNAKIEMQQFSSNSQQQILTPTDDGGIDGNTTKGNIFNSVDTNRGIITNGGDENDEDMYSGVDSTVQNHDDDDDDGDDDLYKPGENVTAGM